MEPLPRFVDAGRPTLSGVRAGEYLWAQTIRTFCYLRQRVDRGEFAPPEGALPANCFGPTGASAVAPVGLVELLGRAGAPTPEISS